MTKSGKSSRKPNRIVRKPATKFAHLRKRMQQGLRPRPPGLVK